jgi:exosortase
VEIVEQEKTDQQQTSIIYYIIIGIVTFLFFWPYFKWLGISWKNNPLDTFGYLAPFVSLWAIYSKRKGILAKNPSHHSRGWFFFITGVFLSLLFHLNGQAIVACIGLPVLLYGLGLILWGKERSRYLVFPIFFLLFLYPWGDLLDFLIGYNLRRLTVLMSYLFFKIIGMEAAVSGTYLFTGRFLVDIAPACSGLTIMNVLLFIGVIGVYLYQGSIRSKIFILISIIPIAILSNTIRIISTGLLGHFQSEETALNFYHNLSGMIVFGIAMLVLYGEGMILKACEKSIKVPNDN